MKIKVTYTEQLRAHEVALERIRSIYGEQDHASRYDRRITFHEYCAQIAESIGAEIAVARYFGITDFDPANSRFKETADVGSNIEVKWTKYEMGSLIIYEKDRNSDIAILVTGTSPNYELKGWLPVTMAKNPRWRHRSQPTWWITQPNLHPIENLRRSSYGEAALSLP